MGRPSKLVGRYQPREKLESLWEYIHDDKSDEKPSWKYLTYVEKVDCNGDLYALWIKNPHFAYEELSPFSKYDMSLEDFNNGVWRREQYHEFLRR